MSSTAHHPFPCSTEEIWGYVEDVIEITRRHRDFRRAGTPGDRETRSYLLDRLRDFGLHNVKEDTQVFARRDYDQWQLEVGGELLPCFYLRSSGFTPAEGVEAELVHIEGQLTPEADVAEKIVVMNIDINQATYPAITAGLADYVFDPEDSFAERDPFYLISTASNFPGSFYMAAKMGAVGFIGLLPFETGTAEFYPDSSMIVRPEMPALYVGRYVGENLLKHPAGTRARLTLTGSVDEFATTANVLGVLPGLTDDAVMITTHFDTGWEGGVQDASGVAAVLGMARYFAEQPGDIYRQKTLVFNFGTNHFGWDYPVSNRIFQENNPELFGNLCAAIGIEHIAREVRVVDGAYEPTGRNEPHVIWAPRSPMLRQVVQQAVETHRLSGSFMIRPGAMALIGEAKGYYFNGIPSYQIISAPPYLYDPVDTIEMVDRDRLAPVTQAAIDIVEHLTNVIPGNWIE